MEGKLERNWSLTKRSYSVHVEVIAPLYDAMLRILESGVNLNLSEYVGALIEKDVEGRGIELEPIEAFGGEGRAEVVISPKIVETSVVSTRVPMPMLEMINRRLDSGFYLKVSDYLRNVIKRDLEARGMEPRLVETGEEEHDKSWKPSATVRVSTRVPMPMMDDIDQILASGFYLRVSDYLIDLIRKDLEARGVTLVNEIT